MAEQSTDRIGRQRLLRNDDLPDRVDLRSSLPTIRDQGARSTCLAFAVTAAHEVIRNGQSGIIEDLSEEVLYWGCKQVDGDREPGSVFTSASAALMQWGQPLEELWPYNDNRDDTDLSYKPPDGALDGATCFKAPMRRIPANIQSIKTWLSRGYSVALGIILCQGFYIPFQGTIPMPTSDEELTEGHAVLVVGYENGSVSGEGFLILRNSWGLDWGEEGYGYLPFAYVDLYGAEAWIVEQSKLNEIKQ
jgi:C1A family cysteine protease